VITVVMTTTIVTVAGPSYRELRRILLPRLYEKWSRGGDPLL
jgi:hypothetical protein